MSGFYIKPGTKMVVISGDRNHPLIAALLDLPEEQRSELKKVIRIIPSDGYPLSVHEMEGS